MENYKWKNAIISAKGTIFSPPSGATELRAGGLQVSVQLVQG